jgi:hypothetical protein
MFFVMSLKGMVGGTGIEPATPTMSRPADSTNYFKSHAKNEVNVEEARIIGRVTGVLLLA